MQGGRFLCFEDGCIYQTHDGIPPVYRNHYSIMKSWILLHAVVMLAPLDVMVSIPAVRADFSQAQQDKLGVCTTLSVQQQKIDSNCRLNAAGPAFSRTCIQPVGVFAELEDSPTNSENMFTKEAASISTVTLLRLASQFGECAPGSLHKLQPSRPAPRGFPM